MIRVRLSRILAKTYQNDKVRSLKTMIAELMKAGVSQAEIAVRAKSHQPVISKLSTGENRTTCYYVGKRIEAMHAKLVLKPKERR